MKHSRFTRPRLAGPILAALLLTGGGAASPGDPSDALGQPITKVAPSYPEDARQAGVQGTVVLNVSIDETGHPTAVEVIKGHELLREAARTAVRQWRWEPVRVDGKPLAVAGTVTVNFRLNGGGAKADPPSDPAAPTLTIRKKVPPQYPEQARAEGVQGPVTLKVVIDTDGRPIEVTATEGHDLLRPAATEAVRQWQWEPVRVEGRLVKYTTTVTVTFRLN